MRPVKAAITLIAGLAVLLGLATAWGGEEGGPAGGRRGDRPDRPRWGRPGGPERPGGPQQRGGPERPGPGQRGPGMIALFANIPEVKQELERHRQTLRTIMEGQREAFRGVADEMRKLRQQGATQEEIREALKKRGPAAQGLAGKLADEVATHYANMAKILTENREAIVQAITERVRQRIRQRRPGGRGGPGEGPPGGPPRGRGPRGRGPRRGPGEEGPQPPANL